jgi:hypothetical protein
VTVEDSAATRWKQASDLLWDRWHSGRRIGQLPDDVRPRTREEGYSIQACLEERSSKPLAGWKIAATSTAGQQHINVDGPLAGRLLAEKMFESGADLPFGANHMRVAEAEFAFRMNLDLPPRSDPYTVDDVLSAVGTLHPAIEIPDSRYEDFTIVGAPQLSARRRRRRSCARGEGSQRTRRSTNRPDMAGQRTLVARADAACRTGRHHRHLPDSVADRGGRARRDGLRAVRHRHHHATLTVRSGETAARN